MARQARSRRIGGCRRRRGAYRAARPEGVCTMSIENLTTYLNDHLAGSIMALELIKHAAQPSAGTPLARSLEQPHGEIEEDQTVVRDLLRRLDASENPVKQAAAWLAEKAGRVEDRCVGHLGPPGTARGPRDAEARHSGEARTACRARARGRRGTSPRRSRLPSSPAPGAGPARPGRELAAGGGARGAQSDSPRRSAPGGRLGAGGVDRE